MTVLQPVALWRSGTKYVTAWNAVLYRHAVLSDGHFILEVLIIRNGSCSTSAYTAWNKFIFPFICSREDNAISIPLYPLEINDGSALYAEVTKYRIMMPRTSNLKLTTIGQKSVIISSNPL